MAVADAPQLPAQQTLSAPVEVDFNSARTRSEADLQKTMENARRKLAEIDALLGKTVE